MKALPFLKQAAFAIPLLFLQPQVTGAPDKTPFPRSKQIDKAQQGEVYKRTLGHFIETADHITLTEISDPKDFPDTVKLPPAGRPKYEYAKVRLTAAQKEDLQKAVAAMDGTTVDSVTRCYFPHHRMDFVDRAGKVTGSMEICFECARVKWTHDMDLSAPKGLMGTLAATVKAAGLETEKDWKKMAREKMKEEAEKQK